MEILLLFTCICIQFIHYESIHMNDENSKKMTCHLCMGKKCMCVCVCLFVCNNGISNVSKSNSFDLLMI